MNTSNFVAASANSLPFFAPDQPSCTTVETWCAESAFLSRAGTHSSSSRRIGSQAFASSFEYGYGTFTRNTGKVFEKVFE